MALQDKTIAFIGAGVMGEAMMKGLLKQQSVRGDQLIAADIHEARVAQLAEAYGLRGTTDNRAAAEAADILVLSVKPQVIGRVMAELRGVVDHASLVLSIIAGTQITTLADGLSNPRVVRVMPNTPGQIGLGISVWTAANAVDVAGREGARALLCAMGEEMYVDDEHFLDMATALNGTGPAYVFLFMEALIDAGVHMGFSRRDAERLVLQTVRGSVEYAIQSGLHPAQLRNQVTSPGGTSAAAIYELEKGGMRTVMADAVWAAYRRARQLGGES
jgi:pyrroline-5-carboxylate reductase